LRRSRTMTRTPPRDGARRCAASQDESPALAPATATPRVTPASASYSTNAFAAPAARTPPLHQLRQRPPARLEPARCRRPPAFGLDRNSLSLDLPMRSAIADEPIAGPMRLTPALVNRARNAASSHRAAPVRKIGGCAFIARAFFLRDRPARTCSRQRETIVAPRSVADGLYEIRADRTLAFDGGWKCSSWHRAGKVPEMPRRGR